MNYELFCTFAAKFKKTDKKYGKRIKGFNEKG